MRSDSNQDTADMKQAREMERSILKEWLSENKGEIIWKRYLTVI